ncbi:hypothetical protein [Rhizobium leguminosarum]|uniref:hypothetical protein n=1 Tax=Rhizobium leguminosarum TaxID=384 RepID=UPI001C920C3A|nr:hypothetical protein [Rhizobium leguminosarum]MBY2916514.1 hypothetical protein [Rhizobium leguminosarum]MBY2934183.1 hypothetical protein [Rhizobium leguminosarum]MBY2971750.1 hypothetical protein [Rhizobium leguminosarum]MBY2979152.1 hypothetical protein [Rhizobium leguminosarum]MBY3000295.1 hypothetical protein [Rhizobium leguminosarum]
MACHPARRHSGHVDRLTAGDSFSYETVFGDLRLAAMKREREPSSKAYRQDRFENTERAAKETIEAEQRARREKTKRLKELRLSQLGAKDPATK